MLPKIQSVMPAPIALGARGRELGIPWAYSLILWAIIPVAYLLQGQDVNYDLQNYHIYNSLRFFANDVDTSNDVIPAGIQTYFNPLISAPAYWIHVKSISAEQAKILGLLLALFQGLCGPLLFHIANVLFPLQRLSCFLCALIGLTAPILLSEAGTSFGDLTILVLQLLAVASALEATKQDRSQSRSFIAFGWGLLGAVSGLKFTGILIAPLLLAGTLAAWLTSSDLPMHKRMISEGPIFTVSFLSGFLVFGWPWFMHAYSNTGNPFFPMFSSIFGSRILDLDNTIDSRFISKSLGQLILAPFFEALRLTPGTLGTRAEIAYADIRQLIWVYSAASCIVFWLLGVIRLGLGMLRKNDYLIPAFFQAGLLCSYFISLRVAGIARYMISVNIFAGVSFLISIYIFSLPFGSALTRYANSKGGLRVQSLPSGVINFILIAMLSVSLATQLNLTWGRLNFSDKWNNVYPARPLAANSAKSLPKESLFKSRAPIVLLEQPFGWIKQYAKSNPLIYPDPRLRPSYRDQIIRIIHRNGGNFYVLATTNSGLVSSDTKFISRRNLPDFKTTQCNNYLTGGKILVTICEALISP